MHTRTHTHTHTYAHTCNVTYILCCWSFCLSDCNKHRRLPIVSRQNNYDKPCARIVPKLNTVVWNVTPTSKLFYVLFSILILPLRAAQPTPTSSLPQRTNIIIIINMPDGHQQLNIPLLVKHRIKSSKRVRAQSHVAPFILLPIPIENTFLELFPFA